MKIVAIRKDTNVKALLGTASKDELQTLQRMNPHLDFKKLKPGAMIIVPDDVAGIDFPKGDLKSIGAEAMASFIDFADDALKASSKRMKLAAERAKAEEGELASALKSKGVADAMAKDPPLRTMAEQAAATAAQASKDTAAAVKSFDALGKGALAELATLAKRLG